MPFEVFNKDKEANMSDTDWSEFLQQEPLPDTGKKEFEVGQVWLMCCNKGEGVVRRIVRVWDGSGTAEYEKLAGWGLVEGDVSADSSNARHSILLQDVGQSVEQPKSEVAVTPPPKVFTGQRRRVNGFSTHWFVPENWGKVILVGAELAGNCWAYPT